MYIGKTGILPSSSRVSTTVWSHHLKYNEALREKARWELHTDAACYFEQNPGSSSQQSRNCTATYLPSHKPSKYDKQDILDTTGEVMGHSEVTFSHQLLHMNISVLADQQRLTFIKSVGTFGAV